MIGDMLNNNKRRNVKTRLDQVMFKGRKYAREESGYMVCTSGKRTRLHVAMWESAAGREVPVGCVVHHLDWNKSNNTIENLVCLTWEEHEEVHNIVGGEAGKELGYKIKRERGLDVPPGL